MRSYLDTLTGEGLARNYILPEFGGMTLTELVNIPGYVADWHSDIKSSASADHAARILSACYKLAAKRDPNLPMRNPSAAVKYHPLVRSQRALAYRDYPKWREAWEDIEDPARKAYQMIGLLSGMRSGELGRFARSPLRPWRGRYTQGECGSTVQAKSIRSVWVAIL